MGDVAQAACAVTVAAGIPRIVVAGAASGVGKTTITAGLIGALRRQGLVVQPFKCGPDYIDPSYHGSAAGRPCRNLDAWMLNDEQLLEGFSRASDGADIAVIEGVMGLFDGCSWEEERGSTAQIAKLLGAPVLLVVDISGVARSAAIAVLGCQRFDPAVRLSAVALNFAGSESHAEGCASAVARATGLPVVGWLPRHARLEIPERHLGLVPSTEQRDADELIAEIACEVIKRFDVAALTELARSTTYPLPLAAANSAGPMPPSSGSTDRRTRRPVVAVARDEAFCFYYPENLELLVEAGCDIEFFKPVHGERPMPAAAAVYLGGGYPELHGTHLASNTGLWEALRDLHARDAPIYAECGGFMALMQELIDGAGHRWPMAGLIPGAARMSGKLAAMGYRHATALRPNLLADGGQTLRGHEFRYSTWECETPLSNTAAWTVQGIHDTSVPYSAGYVSGNLLASYLHVHFGQSPDIANRFVDRLRA
jgi:cobyrinic acid a,c-diamide synthase